MCNKVFPSTDGLKDHWPDPCGGSWIVLVSAELEESLYWPGVLFMSVEAKIEVPKTVSSIKTFSETS